MALACVARPAQAQPQTLLQERLAKGLKGLEMSISTSPDPETAVRNMKGASTRHVLFVLQSLFRISHPKYGAEFERMRDSVKGFEDVLGHYQDQQDYIDYAQSLTPAVEPAKLEALKATQQEKLQEVLAFLEAGSWLPEAGQPSQAVADLKATLAATPWDTAEAERSFLLQRIARQARRAQEDKYDLSLLEDGIHEWRRQLRWVLIYSKSLEGIVTLSPETDACPVPEYADLLTGPISQVPPFNKLSASPLEPKPCVVSRCLFLAVSELNEKLEEIKNLGQSTEILDGHPAAEVFEKAREFRAKVNQTKLFDKLADELSSCAQ